MALLFKASPKFYLTCYYGAAIPLQKEHGITIGAILLLNNIKLKCGLSISIIIISDIITIATKDNSAVVILRSAICNLHLKIDIDNLIGLSSTALAQADTNSWVNQLNTSRQSRKEITPEFILSTLPFSIFLKTTDLNMLTNSIDLKPEISSQLELIDSMSVFNTKSIGVFYMQSKEGAPPPTDFVQFLNTLGVLVNVTEKSTTDYYGNIPSDGSDVSYCILHKTPLMQVAYHVNTLFDYSLVQNSEQDKANKISKYLSKDTVLIVWNESKEQIPQKFYESVLKKSYIFISPFEFGFYEVKVMVYQLQGI